MSGAGSLVDLDQQIISYTKYWRQTDPNGGGGLYFANAGEW